ncbi:MAG: hypothetical protein ACYCW6_03610 [Candidatus Xenobia bacterium]
MRRILLLLLLLAGAAHAAPTQLNQIFITDTVPQGQASVIVQNTNTQTDQDPTVLQQPAPIVEFEAGITPHLEAGVDSGSANGNYAPQYNVKWRAVDEDYGHPAMAIGVATVGNNFSASPFVVFTRTLNYSQMRYQIFRAHHRNIKLRGRRLHAGLIQQNGTVEVMAGTDWEISDQFVATADWISGPQNFISLGGTLVASDTLSFSFAGLYSNSVSRVNGLLFQVSRQLKL